jgi:hypothetical protein
MNINLCNGESNIMTDVFISYAREDKEFVQTLNTTLDKINRKTWVDWNNIPLTADWWREIQSGIEAAETFIFVVTPSSVASKVCRDEIEYAVHLNKRLVPIIRDDSFGRDRIHPALSKHNWLLFREDDNFEEAFLSLIKALDTDLEYVRTHTRLLRWAIEWDNKGRTNDMILRGRDFEDAQEWLEESFEYRKNPPPSVVITEYIEVSGLNYERMKKKERYNLLKNETLKKYVHSYLVDRKNFIEDELPHEYNRAIERDPHNKAGSPEYWELSNELVIILNLLGEKARWHPQSAERTGETGGYGDSIDVYTFPCCQKVIAIDGGPSQFSVDGCEDAPL